MMKKGDDMLDRISFLFPPQELLPLFALLREADEAHAIDAGVILRPNYPAQGRPETVFASADVLYPMICFEGARGISIRLADLLLTSGVERIETSPTNGRNDAIEAQTIKAQALYERFSGHIARVDHTGVEIPSAMLSMQEWQDLQASLGRVSNLYAYPTGQEWPFIVPGTDAEFADEIRQFDAPRTPKFELTYGFVDEPLLQVHIDTTLPRAIVEAILPEGFKLGGVVESFRSVFIAHPWANLKIRCDLTFNPEGVLDSWDSGEWLVTEGRRIRS
jgi:hypothetical protein